MLESLKDVNSGLALEKYSGKILQGGLVVVRVVPMLASILEGCFEFITRPTISPELVDLAGMVAVVTGGCGAVGIELAILLAGSGANVILGCRGAGTESTDATGSAVEAEARLVRAGLWHGEESGERGSVQIWPLELASFADVRTFAQRVADDLKAVDILVHTAATKQGCFRTVDEHEVATQVNYLSPFLLTHLLSPYMMEGSARVVHTTCDAALATADWLPWPLRRTAPDSLPKIDLRALDRQQPGEGPDSVAGPCNAHAEYANAKLAVVSHSHELNRRMNHAFTSVGVSHVVNPGAMNNPFGQSNSEAAKSSWRSNIMGYLPPVWIGKNVYNFVAVRTLRSSQAGAKAVFHVASSPALGRAEVGGRLYSDVAGAFTNCGKDEAACGSVALGAQPPAASDRDLASTLWARTGHAIGLDFMRPLRGPKAVDK
jgi:NAD(P)-dependent dehydrogenase (short-subunit alcohol dehydrogenase family)